MKATKRTVTFTIEVLSMDSVLGVLQDAIQQINTEKPSGNLHYEDGDEITWKVVTKEVEF